MLTSVMVLGWAALVTWRTSAGMGLYVPGDIEALLFMFGLVMCVLQDLHIVRR